MATRIIATSARRLTKLARAGGSILALVLPLLYFAAAVVAQPDGAIVVRVSDVIGFAVRSSEQLPAGLYAVDYQFARTGEMLALTAQDESSMLQAIVLQYDGGLVASMEVQLESPNWIVFSAPGTAEGARWRDPIDQGLPDAATLERVRQDANQAASLVRDRLGLTQFRGLPSDEAHLRLRGRDLVSVVFESFSYRGASYTLLDPLTDAMTEVLSLDEFVEEWIIAVSPAALRVEHRAITPTGNLSMILTWNNGQWRGELQDIRAVSRQSSVRPLSLVEAQDLWQRARSILINTRERFRTSDSMIPLAQFGSPRVRPAPAGEAPSVGSL